jgi:hypothetical protein
MTPGANELEIVHGSVASMGYATPPTLKEGFVISVRAVLFQQRLLENVEIAPRRSL